MAKPHIPNLSDIKSLPNEEIRFYALAGAIMSLAAGLELSYFDLFERATRIKRDTAARVFYLITNASTHRDMANAVVSDTYIRGRGLAGRMGGSAYAHCRSNGQKQRAEPVGARSSDARCTSEARSNYDEWLFGVDRNGH
jgi:hypothetical protein